jgi:hypothetical protein
MKWPDVPAPPLRAQLDVHALNPANGTIRACVQLLRVRVPILEKQRLGRWLVVDRELLELDSARGTVRTVAEFPHEPCWPRKHGDKLAVAWRARGLITAAALDVPTGKVEIEHEWKRKASKAVELRPLSDAMALQVNDQFVNLLDDRLVPRWEVRVRPYVYGVAAHGGGPVFVAAAGGGGGLAAFDRTDGSPLVEARMAGGAWDPIAVPGTSHLAAACGQGLVVAKLQGAAVSTEVTPIPGVRALVDAGNGRVALLCGGPTPGIHVVEVK